MGIVPQNDTYKTDDLELDIGIFKIGDKLHLQFKSGWDYFFTPNESKHLELTLKNRQLKENVEICKRNAMAQDDPQDSFRHLLVVRPPSQKMATFEFEIDMPEKDKTPE